MKTLSAKAKISGVAVCKKLKLIGNVGEECEFCVQAALSILI
jgi:hypothetical protein